jgi:hypothetical protein
MKLFLYLVVFVFLIGCQPPQRNCTDFKNGVFTFTALVGGVEKTTSFTRNDLWEVSTYDGVIDSASVRWINECEYVVQSLNKANPQAKPIHIKILSTDPTGYTFEYSMIGSAKKQRGKATKQ